MSEKQRDTSSRSGKTAAEAEAEAKEGQTTGNVGLSEDVFAESRAREEAAIKAREDAAEANKVPTEALTDEAREYTEAGEEAQAEIDAENAAKIETTETGVAPDQTRPVTSKSGADQTASKEG